MYRLILKNPTGCEPLLDALKAKNIPIYVEVNRYLGYDCSLISNLSTTQVHSSDSIVEYLPILVENIRKQKKHEWICLSLKNPQSPEANSIVMMFRQINIPNVMLYINHNPNMLHEAELQTNLTTVHGIETTMEAINQLSAMGEL